MAKIAAIKEENKRQSDAEQAEIEAQRLAEEERMQQEITQSRGEPAPKGRSSNKQPAEPTSKPVHEVVSDLHQRRAERAERERLANEQAEKEMVEQTEVNKPGKGKTIGDLLEEAIAAEKKS